MKKKSSIIKLSIIGVVLVIGLVLSFATIPLGGFNVYHSFASKIRLGLDLKGGIYAVYDAKDKDDVEEGDTFASRLEGTRTSLQSLLTQKGYMEATVVKEGSDRLRVEVPDVESPDAILKILGEPAEIKFIIDLETEGDKKGDTIITGEHISSANAQVDGSIILKLTDTGKTRFYNGTSANVGKTMSIVSIIGDEERTISSPKINEAISGDATISGIGSATAAEELANQIMSGTFSVVLSLRESSTISATLGEGALKWGLIAGIIGIILIMALMCFLYRMMGVVASISLITYTVLMLFILAVFPYVQLTLPGIAGILLSIGMAVDGNIIIYERIKDEYRNGKSILSSYHYGFKRANFAIIDGNVTTAIAAIMLIIFPTGTIQGFAITLLIGLVLSVFCSLVVTRGLLKYFLNINSSNPALYKLKRGKDYMDLGADQTAASIQEQIDLELKEKAKKAREKNEQKNIGEAGGSTHERA